MEWHAGKSQKREPQASMKNVGQTYFALKCPEPCCQKIIDGSLSFSTIGNTT